MNELRRTVDLRVNRLGDSEYLLAYSRATEKTESAILDEIEKLRKPFEQNRVGNTGSGAFASAEVWKSIAEESEKAARKELLTNSAEFNELERLEKAAAEARKLADSKNRELHAMWDEYNSIPEKVEKIGIRRSQIDSDLESLDAAKIEADFKNLYRALLDGVYADALALDMLAARLVTAPLRKEVLTKKASGLEVELKEVTARSKAWRTN